jgi:hypothetical protein
MTERIRGKFKTTGLKKIRIGTSKEGKPIYVWSDGDLSKKDKLKVKNKTIG